MIDIISKTVAPCYRTNRPWCYLCPDLFAVITCPASFSVLLPCYLGATFEGNLHHFWSISVKVTLLITCCFVNIHYARSTLVNMPAHRLLINWSGVRIPNGPPFISSTAFLSSEVLFFLGLGCVRPILLRTFFLAFPAGNSYILYTTTHLGFARWCGVASAAPAFFEEQCAHRSTSTGSTSITAL